MTLNLLIMTQEELKEYALLYAENVARAKIETFCESHGIPVEAIEKTETGYRFCIEFNYKD